MEHIKSKKKFTAVSVLHYVRLVYRSVLFLLLAVWYLSFRLRSGADITLRIEQVPVILTVTWAVYVLEMVLRFFPSR